MEITANNSMYDKYVITLLHQLPQGIKENILYTLEDLVEQYHTDNKPLFEQRLGLLNKPMRKTVTIDQLATEQNYKGFDSEKANKIIKDLALEEPIEELLKVLSK